VGVLLCGWRIIAIVDSVPPEIDPALTREKHDKATRR
jgi:hypothetical protein